MASSQDKDENYGEGHRERLRERLLDKGGDALLDHELLEYLLMLAIPRIDTKPTTNFTNHIGRITSSVLKKNYLPALCYYFIHLLYQSRRKHR